MQSTVIDRVKSRISHSKFGEVFFVSSFPEYDVEYVTKLLSILEKEGTITRISKGVYVKARKTRFGTLYPSASELVTLKHGAPKNFAFKGKLIQDIVLALRSIGEQNLTPENERQIAKLLAESPEKETIEHDLRLAPVWMRNIINRNKPKEYHD